MSFKFISFLFFLMLNFPLFLKAQNNIDYNKPFDEIKADISAFDTRHSLMPLEEKKNNVSVENPILKVNTENQTFDVEKKENESLKPEIVNNEELKKEIVKPVFEVNQIENTVSKDILNNDNSFVLKEASVQKYDGNDIVVSNTVEEKSDTIISKPLFENNNIEQGNIRSDASQIDVNYNLLVDSEKANVARIPVMKPVENTIKPMFAPKNIQQNFDNSDDVKLMSNDVINVENNMLEVKNQQVISAKQNENNNLEQKQVSTFSNQIVKEKYEKSMQIPVNEVKNDVSKSLVNENLENKSMAHIASYLAELNAYNGLKILEQKYPQFNIFKPYVKYEEIPNKGWYYRLYLVGDRQELLMLCKDMKKNNDWCNVIK